MYGITNSRLVINNAPSDVIKVKANYKLLAGSLVDVELVDDEYLVTPIDGGTSPSMPNTFRGQLMENTNGDGTTEFDCRVLNSNWFSAVEADYSANAVTMYDASHIVPYSYYQGVYGDGVGPFHYIPNGAVAFNQYTANTEWCFCGTNFDYDNLNDTHTLLSFEDSAGGDNTDLLTIQANKDEGVFSLSFKFRSLSGSLQTVTILNTSDVVNFISSADNLGTCKCRLFVSLTNNNDSSAGNAPISILYIDDITDKNSKKFYKQYTLNNYGSNTYMVATPMFVCEKHYLIASGCGIHSIGNGGYYCLAGVGASNYGSTHIRTYL